MESTAPVLCVNDGVGGSTLIPRVEGSWLENLLLHGSFAIATQSSDLSSAELYVSNIANQI